MQIAETALIGLINHSVALSVPYRLLPNGVLIYTLFQSGDRMTQIVVIPPGVTVPEHSHPNVNKTVQPIFGTAYCCRGGKCKTLIAPDKAHVIDAGVMHSVKTYNSPFMFISQQVWINGVTPTSIDEDWKDAE